MTMTDQVLAKAMKADLLKAEDGELLWYDNDDYAYADLDAIADTLIPAGWTKTRLVDEGELTSLPIGSAVRNVESGTIAVRESEKDWFITGLDYELESWELYNHEGREWMVLFAPGGGSQ